MTEIVELSREEWRRPPSHREREQAIGALESGNVLVFPRLSFRLRADECRLLTEDVAGRAKNVALLPSGAVHGAKASGSEIEPLRRMMARFADAADALVRSIVPRYAANLERARTSFRPLRVAERRTSWRKDDTRLHVDSFPASPMRGRRILRVFANVDPARHARRWRVGEPFEDVAGRYARGIPAPIPGASLLLRAVRITKSRRSAYDHYMLRLHDRMKADASYQAKAGQRLYDFPAGSTWIVFTDQVSHAAMSGQYALEQTFHLPVRAMQDPTKSPLRVLERLLDRRLA